MSTLEFDYGCLATKQAKALLGDRYEYWGELSSRGYVSIETIGMGVVSIDVTPQIELVTAYPALLSTCCIIYSSSRCITYQTAAGSRSGAYI